MRGRCCYKKRIGDHPRLMEGSFFNMEERNEYWKTMYEELELQMKDMMSMTLELIESNDMEKQKTIEKVTKENNRLREEVENINSTLHMQGNSH
jgi:hypothetical protein